MAYDNSFYTQQPWRRFRAAFLAQHPVCVAPGCGQPATVVDHVVARSRGGASFDPANCVPCCQSCHNRKTRLHDQPRRTGTYTHTLPGCDATGLPIAPDHHWRK